MSGKSYIKVFTAKSGKRCIAIVVPYADGAREKLVFTDYMTYMQLLDMSPAELAELPNGEYEIR